MPGERGEYVLHERCVTLRVAAVEQFLSAALELFGPATHGVRIELTDIVIAFEPESLR